MQKNLIHVTNFAIFLATFLWLSMPGIAKAQELSSGFISIEQPGVYGVAAQKPLNTLLIPVNPQDRWNVLYQQTPDTTVVAGIQFNNNLHVYVTQPDPALVSTMSAINAPVATPSATPGPQVKGLSTDQPATPSAVITIDKFDHPATPAASLKPATTPKPVATTMAALGPSDLDSLFEKYGQEYGVSATVLKHIAKCESGFRPEALSKNGLYGGLFQFVASTWSANRKAMGLDPDPALRFNAEEAIRTAAFKISRGGINAWPVCGKKATGAAA